MSIPTASEGELRRARRFGDLIWADGHIFAYKYRGMIYVMEPPTELLEQVIDAVEAAYPEPPGPSDEEREFYGGDKWSEEEMEALMTNPPFIVDSDAIEKAALDAMVFGCGQLEITHDEPQGLKFEFIPPQEIDPRIFGEVRQEETETAPLDVPFDPAVLMHLTHELAWSLRTLRNLFGDRITNSPFSMRDHDAWMESGELLDQYAKEYGVDWQEADEQDKLLRG